ncbi:MAG: hypothetical protein Q7S04_03475 [Candidatus Moranbacteria bacterium]|nr:hypothetical protein [Candidatus Moranbacteria bacterium]
MNARIRHENPPTFKVGQLVCFELPGKKEPWNRYWNIGVIVSLLAKKNNEAQLFEVRPYEIPEPLHPYEPEAEWACLDPLRISLDREVFILDFLDTQTQVVIKKSSKTIQVSVADLCPARYDRFRRALTEGKTLPFSGKKSFW